LAVALEPHTRNAWSCILKFTHISTVQPLQTKRTRYPRIRELTNTCFHGWSTPYSIEIKNKLCNQVIKCSTFSSFHVTLFFRFRQLLVESHMGHPLTGGQNVISLYSLLSCPKHNLNTDIRCIVHLRQDVRQGWLFYSSLCPI